MCRQNAIRISCPLGVPGHCPVCLITTEIHKDCYIYQATFRKVERKESNPTSNGVSMGEKRKRVDGKDFEDPSTQPQYLAQMKS